MSNSLPPHGLCSPWNSPGQNTGVGSHSLLQGIFPTQGSNPGLLHHRQILHQLSHKECSKLERTCSSLNYSNSNIVLTLWTNAIVASTKSLQPQFSRNYIQVALVVKKPLANAGDRGDTGSIPGSGRSPGGGHGNPLQYSCLKNSMDIDKGD